MSDFDDTICQLRDLGMSKVANILRDLERDNMMLMSNNLKHRERIAEMERVANKAQAGEPVDYRYKGADGLWYRTIPHDVKVIESQALYTHPTTERRVPEDSSKYPMFSKIKGEWVRFRNIEEYVQYENDQLNAAPKGEV
jgi:hypothetical protein